MRHRTAGKQLSRNSAHRRALRRNMAASLFENGSIRTTETKAKQLRGFVEKLITMARKDTLAARRQVIKKLQDRYMAQRDENGHIEFGNDGLAELQDKTVVQKLFEEIAPKYADRPGGYTRIIHLAERRIGDAGKQVILQLVEATDEGDTTQTTGRRKKRAAKRHAAIEQAAPAAAGTAEAGSEATADEPAPEATEEAPEAEAPAEDEEPKAE